MASAVSTIARAGIYAATNFNTGLPRTPNDAEREIVRDIMQEFSQYTNWRSTFAQQWEESAELILPTSRNTFFYQNFNWPGQKKTQQQVDASGMLALHRFAAICDSLLTPRNMIWHTLSANDDYVMKDRATRLWFEQVTKILFKYRYAPIANFSAQNNSNFQSLGAFGNATMFVDAFDGRDYGGQVGLRYKAVPLGETFYGENHQGRVDRIIRWFRMTAYQAVQRWGMPALPAGLRSAYEQHSQWLFNFLHCVRPRRDYDGKRLDARSLPFESHYVSIEGQCLMQLGGGYRSFPYSVSRYDQTPLEVYGRGPAQMVLPALKTLNAQKRTFLKQGHRASDPVLLVSDDGIIGMDLRPGAVNKGGVSAEGRPMVHVLPTGNIQVNEMMMDMERAIINDVFLVTLFQILTETPEMTATEVIERTNEKGILLAPTIGRQQSEYLGPMIDRELDILSTLTNNGVPILPEMPPRLREAGGSYEVEYTSPLARAQKAQEVSGFFRWTEQLSNLAQQTGDPSVMDRVDYDTASPAIAETLGVPESWVADDRAVVAKRKNRADMQARQEQIQAAPAQAGIMKAQAAQVKAGMVSPQGGQQPGGQPGQQPQGAPGVSG
ncbi:MAG TPA: portal protein [Bradyrhizobium sp.]